VPRLCILCSLLVRIVCLCVQPCVLRMCGCLGVEMFVPFAPIFLFRQPAANAPKPRICERFPYLCVWLNSVAHGGVAARPRPTPRDKLLNEPSRSIVPLSSSNKEDVLFCTNTKML